MCSDVAADQLNERWRRLCFVSWMNELAVFVFAGAVQLCRGARLLQLAHAKRLHVKQQRFCGCVCVCVVRVAM